MSKAAKEYLDKEGIKLAWPKDLVQCMETLLDDFSDQQNKEKNKQITMLGNSLTDADNDSDKLGKENKELRDKIDELGKPSCYNDKPKNEWQKGWNGAIDYVIEYLRIKN